LLARSMPSLIASSKPSGWTALSSVTRATVILCTAPPPFENGSLTDSLLALPSVPGTLNVPPNFREFITSETVRKGFGGACNVALRAIETLHFGPSWPPYTGDIHRRSVARTPFRTVSRRRVLRSWLGRRVSFLAVSAPIRCGSAVPAGDDFHVPA
jgi:hypothetical protein